MSIKLIATDMDGTFLRDDHTYNHSLFAKVFRQLERHNIYFVAASGSSFPRLQREFRDYTAKMGFISQNGSVIHLGSKLFKSFPILSIISIIKTFILTENNSLFYTISRYRI